MTIDIALVPVTSFQQNCRVLFDSESRSAVIVDPGGEANRIVDAIEQRGATVEAIWLTHSHLDHCGGVADLLKKYPVPLLGHRVEGELRARVDDICKMYGIPLGEMKNCPEPTEYLQGGEELSFGGAIFEVKFCPGHSPGHLVFWCSEHDFLLAGDTLFAGSLGRTDLPGGNHQQLLESITTEIYSLPDSTQVLSGHGPDTTVGHEKVSNPFVRGMDR